jgi:tetratricopeptide (TPR) repeat protein
VTDLARADVFVGAGWEAAAAAAGAPASRPAWSRLYDHALALQHAVQERVHEAIPSLDRALALLEEAPLPAGDDRARAARDRERAMVLALLARTAAREGRSADAVAFLERAEPLAPGDPALARLHGDALAAVWRWKESVPWLRAAALASPRDDDAWAALATALGSAGDDAAALDAARRALASWPRHPDLLRVQALALEHLGAPPDLTAAALEAYLTCRRTDEAPGVRAACSKLVPGCALERVPVHVHVMRAAPRS